MSYFNIGASEIILESCSEFYDITQGKIVPLTSSLKQVIEEQIEAMSDQALRTICIAYKEIHGDEGKNPFTNHSHLNRFPYKR